MTKKLYFIFLLIIINVNSIAQLADTSLIYYFHKAPSSSMGGGNYEFIRKYVIANSGGTYLLTEYTPFAPVPVTTSSTSPYFYSRTITSFDSINSIKTNTNIQRIYGLWGNISRNLVSYDNLGRVTDTLYQQWNSNGYWVDTSNYSCVYNSFDSLIYFQTLKWNGTQWTNKSRTEFYYSFTHKDSLILTLQGNLQNWVPAKSIKYTYDNSDSLTQILTQTWNGSTWDNSIQETFTYYPTPVSSEYIKQEWINANWLNKIKLLYYYNGGSIDSAHYYTADITGNFYPDYSVYKFFTGKSYTLTYDHYGSYNLDSADTDGHLIKHFHSGYFSGYTTYISEGYKYDSKGKLAYYGYSSWSVPPHNSLSYQEYYWDPLINYFPLQTVVDCQSDTLLISSDVTGPDSPFSYQWTSTGYIDNPSAPNIRVATDANTKYYLTVRDTFGNVFHDSIYVGKQVPVFLGADIHTIPGSLITLDAGAGYSSYLWQDSSTNRYLNITPTDSTPFAANVFVTDSNGCTGTDTINISFSLTKIEEWEKENIVVSPNPATDYLKINSTIQGEIKLYDSIGKNYLSMKVNPGTNIISLTKIPRGIYLLDISSEKGHQIKKIIFQ